MVSKTMIAEARNALFDEGLLGEQFEELEALQGPEDSTFVEDIVEQFLNDMRGLFEQVEKELGQDTPKAQVLDKVLHQIKGSSASVGAKQISIICNEMREYVHKGEIQKCRDAFVQMDNQLALLGQRLPTYFELCKQAATEGSESPSSGYESATKDGAKGKGK